MAKISKERIGSILKVALQALSDNNGQLPSREVVQEVDKKIVFNEYESGTLEKTGNIRWQSILHFYSIDLQKAGWLVKKGGVWYITPEGVESLKLPPKQFLVTANQKYREWRKHNKSVFEKSGLEVDKDEGLEESEERLRLADYEQAQDLARKKIIEFVNTADPYVFQDMVAALLRGMGYHTSFVAPKGKDGGIDIIAYRDPFGVQPPRMKVQVKHREKTKTTPQEVQQLVGILNDEDIGLFVSTGGFTSDAISAIRNSKRHMEKLDLDEFIDMWVEYYDKMDEDDKLLIPLRKIWYLAPTE